MRIRVVLPTSRSNIDVSSLYALPLGVALRPTACQWWSTKWTKGFPTNSSFPFEITTSGRGMPTRGRIHLKSHPRCRVPWPRGWTPGRWTGRCLLQKEPPTSLAASLAMGARWRGGECVFQGLPWISAPDLNISRSRALGQCLSCPYFTRNQKLKLRCMH